MVRVPLDVMVNESRSFIQVVMLGVDRTNHLLRHAMPLDHQSSSSAWTTDVNGLVWPASLVEAPSMNRHEDLKSWARSWQRLHPNLQTMEGLNPREQHAVVAKNVAHVLQNVLPEETFQVLREVNLNEALPERTLRVARLVLEEGSTFPSLALQVLQWFTETKASDACQEAFHRTFGSVEGIKMVQRPPMSQEREAMVKREIERLSHEAFPPTMEIRSKPRL